MTGREDVEGAMASAPATGVLVGIGIDSVDLARMERVLRRRPALVDRVFTAHERAYAARMPNPTQTFAGRFAAKEAVMKALGVGLGAFDWWDAEVRRRTGGRPVLLVTGRAADLAARRGVTGWQVSITHTETVASAVAVALA